MAYDGTLKFDTSVDSSGFSSGISTIKSAASTGLKVTAGIIAGAAAGIVAFGASSVSAGAEFDSAMSQLAATMGTTTDQIEDLRDKAKEMGSSTSFSATEAAEGLNILAQAGYDADQQMDMIESTLNLAAAGATSMDSAASYLTTTLKGYCVSAEDTGDTTEYYSNLIAKGATLVNTSVDELGTAMADSAANANAYGQTVETTTTALLALADGGKTGSEAATALNRLMTDLYAPTSAASDALEELGVSCYDESGEARDLMDVIADLQDATADMDDEQRTAVLNTALTTQGMSAYNAITTKTADEIDDLTASLVDCEGAAAAMADTQLDNLAGDITIAKSALEGLQIAISDEVTPSLRGLVQMGTEQLGILTDAIGAGGLQGGIEACGDVLANVVGYVADLAPSIIEAASSLITNFCEGLKNTTLVTDAVGETITALISALLSCAGDIWSTALVLITNLAGGLADGIPDIMDAGVEMVTQLVSAIGENGPQLAQAAVDIINSLTTYLAENFPTMVQSGLETLMSFSEGLRTNVGLIVDAALELVMTLAQGIIDNIPTIIETVPTIITNLAGCINDNAPKLVQTAFTLIGQLASGLIQAIPTLIANIPQILDAIVSAFMAFNWIDLGANLIELITNGVKSLAESIPNAMSELASDGLEAVKNIDWLQLGSDVVAGIVEGITGAFGSITTAATELGSSILSGFCSFLGINSPSKVMKEQGGYIVDGVVEGIAGLPTALSDALSEALTSVTEWGSQLASMLGTAVTTAVANVGQYFANMGATISEALGTALTVVTTWGSNLIIAMQTAVTGAVTAVGTAFTGITTTISTALSGAISTVLTWGSSLTSSIRSAVAGAVTAAGTAFNGIATSIQSALSGALKTVTSWGKNISSTISSAAKNALTQFTTQISKLPANLSNQLTSAVKQITSFASTAASKMRSAGTAAVSAIYGGLSGISSKVRAQLNGVTSTVKSWGSSLKSSFTSIGKNVMSGLISGIKSMVSSLYSSIKSALSGLVSKAKSALGIHSPSTVFRDAVGAFIPAGIAEGIDQNTAVAEAAVEDMANSLSSSGAVDTGSSVALSLDADTSALEEKLKNLGTSVTVALTDKLKSAVEFAQTKLQVGQAERGTYQAQKETGTAFTAGDTKVEISGTIETPVNLDGKEVARGITPFVDKELSKRATKKERGSVAYG